MRRQTTIVPWKRAASKWPKPWKRACARGKWQDQVGKRAWELRLAKACGNGLSFPHTVLPTYCASHILCFPHTLILHTSFSAVIASSSISALHRPCKRATPCLGKWLKLYFVACKQTGQERSGSMQAAAASERQRGCVHWGLACWSTLPMACQHLASTPIPVYALTAVNLVHDAKQLL